MKEKFVKDLPNFIDIDYMKKLVLPMVTEEWLNMRDYIALGRFTDVKVIDVAADEYLTSIKEKYPKLNFYLKIMKSSTNWSIHVDNSRASAINIPISGCDESIKTVFYEGGELVESTISNGYHYLSNEYVTYVQGAEPVYEYACTVPTLINTNVTHSVKYTKGTENLPPRIIASWAYNGSFEEAVADIP